MPLLSEVLTDPSHLRRLQAVKSVADDLLKPGETYLDLTGRHDALRLSRPKAAGGHNRPFNMASTGEQLRALRQLREERPPLAIFEAKNFNFEGQTPALRTYWLYRFGVLNYIPFERDGIIFGIVPERAGSLSDIPPTSERLDLLNRAFLLPHLDWLPVAWGRSYEDELRAKMEWQFDLPVSEAVLERLTREQDGKLRVDGASPTISFDLSGLRGEDAGMLEFHLRCENRAGPSLLRVGWSSELSPDFQPGATACLDEGWIIFPVDAQPGWLASEDPNVLRLTIESAGCSAYDLSDVHLASRFYP